MKKRWVLVARAEAMWESDPVSPPVSAVLTCPLCARAVRAFARAVCVPVTIVAFACPGCRALVEEVPWEDSGAVALPGATLDELKEAVQQATLEAERWRCQADSARQRKDMPWADQAVAWSTAAEQRAWMLRWQAATGHKVDLE